MFVCLFVYVFQAMLVYFPTNNVSMTPENLGLEYEEVWLESGKDTKIHAWFVPHRAPVGAVLFCHGNAGNMADRIEIVKFLHDRHLHVLMFDYQGYGKSHGVPGEKETYEDATAAFQFLTLQKNIPPERILLFGKSLGGGVASHIAAQTTPAGLVLESTFTSLDDMASRQYPWLPTGLLLRHHYPVRDNVEKLNVPVMILHSPDDEMIPYSMGKELYQAAGNSGTFFEITGGHNDSHVYDLGYSSAWGDFLGDEIGWKR